MSNMHNALVAFGAVALLCWGITHAQTPRAAGGPRPLPSAIELSSPDDAVRQRAIKILQERLEADPRHAMVEIYRYRLAGALQNSGHYQEAADFALLCIQKQPGVLARVYYALTVRAQSLSKLGKHEEALVAAKSLYNMCMVKDTPKAIDVMAECLTAAYPDDPGKARRFKLQQMMGADAKSAEAPALDLGPSVLAEIKIDPKLYAGDALTRERGEWHRFVQASIMLICDQPKEARPIFESLRNSANPKVAAESTESIGRTLKAEHMRLFEANAYLLSLQPGQPDVPTPAPAP